MKTHFPAIQLRLDYLGIPENRDRWMAMVKRNTACWIDISSVYLATDPSAVTCKRCIAQIEKRGVKEVAA